tara:strand:+ start:18941 stop:20233 length:1293 start_codon:yes stop_codon:yes gene_type:complete
MTKKKKKYNVLVFPGGTENGLEIYKSLRYCKEVRLFSASSSVKNHAEYVYKNHFEISNVFSDGWVNELNAVIGEHNINFLFPANDIVIDALIEKRKEINCKIILPSIEVVKLLRSKKITYSTFQDEIDIPKLYTKENIQFPAFSRPDDGYGSQGIIKIDNKNDLLKVCDNSIITEYLPGKEYSIDCFSGKEGELLYCQGRTRERIRMGTTMSSEFVSDKLNDEFTRIAHIITKKLKLIGAWFYQMKENINGDVMLLEISPRIAGTMAFNRVIGVNFPLLSILVHDGLEVSIQINEKDYFIDRSLKNRYKTNVEFDTIYVDLDDTIIVHKQINVQMISFLFQCVNQNKRIILITKSLENNLQDYLVDKKIDRLFDKVIHLKEEDKKSAYIEPNSQSIFIDDSFSQRREVANKCKIPTFDTSMIELLIDDRI